MAIISNQFHICWYKRRKMKKKLWKCLFPVLQQGLIKTSYFFSDVMSFHWVRKSWRFGGSCCLYLLLLLLQRQAAQYLFSLNMKSLQSFATSGSTYPTLQTSQPSKLESWRYNSVITPEVCTATRFISIFLQHFGWKWCKIMYGVSARNDAEQLICLV